MTRSSKLLDNDVVSIAKAELKKLGGYGYVSKKLHAVIAASEHGISDVARIYNISRTTLTHWVRIIKQSAIEKLQAPKERKRKPKLGDHHRSQIQGWVDSNPSITIKELRMKIEDHCGVVLSMSTVHRTMKNLGLSYITPRPRHYKQDQTLITDFKKKSTTRLKESRK